MRISGRGSAARGLMMTFWDSRVADWRMSRKPSNAQGMKMAFESPKSKIQTFLTGSEKGFTWPFKCFFISSSLKEGHIP
jgi:hypothetical protein